MSKPASAECRKPLTGKSALNADEIKAMRAALWHREGIAVIDPEEIPNEFDRQRIRPATDCQYRQSDSRQEGRMKGDFIC